MMKLLSWIAPLAYVTAIGCTGDPCQTIDLSQTAQLALDVPTQQVMIEARIVIASDNFTKELGVQFGLQFGDQSPGEIDTGALGGHSAHSRSLVSDTNLLGGVPNENVVLPGGHSFNGPLPTIQQGNQQPPQNGFAFSMLPEFCFLLGENQILGFLERPIITARILTRPTSPFTLLSDTIDDAQLAAILQAANNDNETDVIQTPRLVTFNTQRSFINTGRQIVDVQDLAEGFKTEAHRVAPDAHFVSTGVTLDVRPVVSADRRYINLELRPTVAAVAQLNEFQTELNGNQVTIQLPIIQVGTVVNKVMVDDGMTVVIGGLKRGADGPREDGVPLLGKLPIVGSLFKDQGQEQEKRNLLIFVTARILSPR